MSLIFIITLSLIQYKYTNPTDYLHLNEIERYEQQKRMNEYPASSARMANWIEARKESVVFFRLEKNFISIFDLTHFFGGLFKPFLFPFFIYGFFELVRLRTKEILVITLIPISTITLAGSANPYGLFSLYPIVYLSIMFGIFLFSKKYFFKQ
jgi:hypothetical protein